MTASTDTTKAVGDEVGAASGEGFEDNCGMRPCQCDIPRCPKCGYTRHDAANEMDHRFCDGVIPASAITLIPITPTPTGDMAGEDDAWLERCIRRLREIDATVLNARRTEITTRRLENWSADISGIARALRSLKSARQGAQPVPAADGWQPIETAPKDKGEYDILVFCADSEEMFVVFWHAGNGWQYAVDPITFRAAMCQPTHWRPLPAAPSVDPAPQGDGASDHGASSASEPVSWREGEANAGDALAQGSNQV